MERPHVPVIKEESAVPRIRCPSLESFNTNYLLPLKPVILEGIIDHWPALNEHPWRFVFVLFACSCSVKECLLFARYGLVSSISIVLHISIQMTMSVL